MHAGANGLPVQYDARSIVNGAFTHSIEYHTVQKDRASRKVDLTFDEKTHKVKRLLNGNPNGETATEKNTLDPLSIIFKFREMDLDQPGEVQSHVSDGKKTFPAKITVIGKEEIKIGDQTYQSILVEPDLGEMRGVFNKDPDATYGATTGALKELASNAVGFLKDTSPQNPPKDVAGWYPVRLLCGDSDTFLGAFQYTGTRFL